MSRLFNITASRFAARTMCFAALAFACMVQQSEASAFRGHIADLAATQGASPELEKALLNEIEEVLGSEHRAATDRRLGRIETALRSTFVALPKNEYGRLGHSAVRYAMHRLFVQRHGWFVRGLEAGGEAWNASSPTAILEDRLPSYVQELFEKRMGQRGFDLHELAVMAATLENLVHKEAMDRLHHTYRSLERAEEDPLSTEEAHEVIDAYMAIYILGFDFTAMTPAQIRERREQIAVIYPTWPETQKFVREVQATIAPKRDELTYENIATVVEEIGERYGRWQDAECRGLKNDLVAVEDKGTGRVLLEDFYGRAVNDGKWQFSESAPYLRQLGALDESDPANPRVIIANYINSPSNCVASSNYYSVCCMDECEDILATIEEKLGAPEALPSDIIATVSALPSATVPGDRILSRMLVRRLDEVSAHHGGRVPLHGRLFAQWIHLAYPRECPFPHVTGTTKPRRSEVWQTESGQAAGMTPAELRQHVASAPPRVRESAQSAQGEEEEEDDGVGQSMWTMEEELLVASQQSRAPLATGSTARSVLRHVFCFFALVSTCVALFQTLASAMTSRRSGALLPKYRSV